MRYLHRSNRFGLYFILFQREFVCGIEFLAARSQRIVGLVEDFNEVLSVEKIDVEATAFQARAYRVHALGEAFFEFVEVGVTIFDFGGVIGRKNTFQKTFDDAAFFFAQGVLRNHHVELFFHDVGVFHKSAHVFNVFKRLFLQEGIGLFDPDFLEFLNVVFQVQFFAADHDLNGKFQRVEEVLIGVNHGILLFFRFEVEVDAGGFQNRAKPTIFKDGRVVANFGDFQVQLGAGNRVFLGAFDGFVGGRDHVV